MKKLLPLIISGSLLLVLAVVLFLQPSEGETDAAFDWDSESSCNVVTIAIQGYLDTQPFEGQQGSFEISQNIRELDLEGKEAILLLIDSNGGSVSAAEEVSRAVEEAEVPVVAFVRGSALSAGYWIASAADHIIALESAAIGSIGVTYSYLDETELNKKEGYTYQEIVSGEYKEVGSVDKPLIERHKKYLKDLTDDLFQIFSETVMRNRGLSKEQFALVSDGKYYVSRKALELGLIDQIGDMSEVEDYLSKEIDLPKEEINICDPISEPEEDGSNEF